MKLIGLDVGRANTGIVIYDSSSRKVVCGYTIELPIAKIRKISMFNDSSTRMYIMRKSILNLLNVHIKDSDESLAIVEDYIYGDIETSYEEFIRSDRNVLALSEIHGVVYECLVGLNIPMIKVSPSQMKYFITGNGHCQKTEIIKRMHNKYGAKLDDDHQYDALGLVHVGRYFIVYCKDPSKLEGTYEYNILTMIAFDKRYSNIAKMFGLSFDSSW